jgi:hypothetical protein
VAITVPREPKSCGVSGPTSSFVSSRSGDGRAPPSAPSAFAMFSRPHPDSASRSSGHFLQPLDALRSSAVRSRIVVTWFAVSFG